MLGKKYDETYPKNKIDIGDILLEVKDLTTKKNEINNVTMNVRKGEIIGIAGLVGAGKSEFCKAIFSALPISKGKIILNGNLLNNNEPYKAVKSRIALVPEERRKEGIIVTQPVYSNLSISSLSKYCNRFNFIKKKEEHKMAIGVIEELKIKTPDENRKIALLSGGNQQKVAVGKWLIADAVVYIFDEPTKGIDVGAKYDVFELIGRLAKEGKSIIYASCETSEILGISDRIYVMYGKTIVKELETRKTNEAEVLYFSTGGK
jgi:simple sugar transport system ATP-binding protein